MLAVALVLIPLLIVFAQAQQVWTPCARGCFPRDAQSSSEFQQNGACPNTTSISSVTTSYWTQTCSCWDYKLDDGSSWSTCSVCGPTNGTTFEQVCTPDPNKGTPVADASCASKSDGISEACKNIVDDVSKAVDVLCDISGAFGLSGKAKGIFSGLKFLTPPLARAALTAVDAGCQIWDKDGDKATQMISSGCDTWNKIGGCPAEDAVTGSSSSIFGSASRRLETIPVTWLVTILAASMIVVFWAV